MKYVQWFFVVLLISSLTSFVSKDQPAGGLSVGMKAPDIHLRPLDAGQSMQTLSEKRGHMVLLSFWASYDAMSRLRNANLNYAVSQVAPDVEMVSISLDEYASICLETIRKDKIVRSHSYRECDAERSDLFKKYRISEGISNYLIDEHGVIVAKNISAKDLPAYLQ